jgi:hypothetical protein
MPASAMFGVAKLLDPRLMVEIKVAAYKRWGGDSGAGGRRRRSGFRNVVELRGLGPAAPAPGPCRT